MNTDQNLQNQQNDELDEKELPPEIKQELGQLIQDAENLQKEIDLDNQRDNEFFDNAIKNVAEISKDINGCCDELDKIEEDAGNKFDELVVNEIKSISEEEED
jgi:hypothetical protein